MISLPEHFTKNHYGDLKIKTRPDIKMATRENKMATRENKMAPKTGFPTLLSRCRGSPPSYRNKQGCRREQNKQI